MTLSITTLITYVLVYFITIKKFTKISFDVFLYRLVNCAQLDPYNFNVAPIFVTLRNVINVCVILLDDILTGCKL